MPDIEKLVSFLRKRLPELELRENEPMSAHTSFRVGGPVKAMAVPKSAEEISQIVHAARECGVEPFVMGNGTNLLADDAPMALFVIRMDEAMAQISRRGETGLVCGAGAPLARIAQTALSLSLGGFEFAAGIPGTLGGAVSMNAGAYGGEMKDVVRSVEYIDPQGSVCRRSGGQLGLSYRHSAFSDSGDIIVSADIELSPGEQAAIRENMRSLAEKRRASQPLELPSAGSTFKRPQGGYAAALIDEAGLKGFAVGGAQVSPKHAGFVVNTGGATFKDIMALMEHIQKTVYERSGIMLEPEVRIIRG